MKNKVQGKPINVFILAKLAKGPHTDEETDEHGLKKMFKALNNWARCPDCDGFLKTDGKKFSCPKCGYTQPATPVPEIED